MNALLVSGSGRNKSYRWVWRQITAQAGIKAQATEDRGPPPAHSASATAVPLTYFAEVVRWRWELPPGGAIIAGRNSSRELSACSLVKAKDHWQELSRCCTPRPNAQVTGGETGGIRTLVDAGGIRTQGAATASWLSATRVSSPAERARTGGASRCPPGTRSPHLRSSGHEHRDMRSGTRDCGEAPRCATTDTAPRPAGGACAEARESWERRARIAAGSSDGPGPRRRYAAAR